MIFIQFIVVAPPPAELEDDLVDAAYVAERLGLKTPRTVLMGKAGTCDIPRAPGTGRRVMFRRGDVDKFLRERGGAAAATPAKTVTRLLDRRSQKRGRTKAA